jgi:hypothetical protein
MKLNEDCGLGPKIPQEVVDKTIDEAIKDPNFKRDDIAQEKILKEEINKKVVDGFNNNINALAEGAVSRDLNKTEDLKNCDLLKIYGSLDLLDGMIVELGYQTPDWDNDQPTSYTNWTFTVSHLKSQQLKGVVKFNGGDSGTFEIYIGDKKIHPV